MICSNCGAQNDDGCNVCKICGSPIDEESVSARNSNGENAKIILISFLITLFLCGGIVVSIVFGYRYFTRRGNSVGDVAEKTETQKTDYEMEQTTESDEEASTEAIVVNVTEYENGDTVYISSQENLAIDTDESVLYYDNLLIVYTLSDLSESEAASLAAQVNGTVVGDISGAVNFLQIQVEATDLATLNSYAEILMESDDVLYASYDSPMLISDDALELDNNPWTDEENEDGEIIAIDDKGNEDNPDGNDWWAEAIGAYTAWDYVDSHENELTSISVGILDNGFDVDHEDLSQITVLNKNSAEDHGTHVTGIISAANNDVGIRGIADIANIVVLDLFETNGEGNTFFDSGEWIEFTKQIYEEGAWVINNSWGSVLYSKSKFNSGELTDEEMLYTSTYEEYLERREQCIRTRAIQAMMILVELQLSVEQGTQDFLIIQCSGNGWNNDGEDGYDASLFGYYAAITEETYLSLSDETRMKLKALGCSYNSLKEHIMIVGAVCNETDTQGNYKMAFFSNYGQTSVDICAPGYGIYSTLILLDDVETDQDEDENSLNGKNYGEMSGTSMAAPMVSAAAALVWSVDPTLTAAEVKEILTTNISTHAVGVTDDDAGMLYPMLNVGLAVLSIMDEENETIVTDIFYDSYATTYGTYEWRVPKINIESNYVDIINSEIWEIMYTDAILLNYKCMEQGYDPEYKEVTYSWSVNDEILTIILSVSDNMFAWEEYYIYNISIPNGEGISFDEILAYKEISQGDYYELARQAMYSYNYEGRDSYIAQYKNSISQITLVNNQLSKTISEDNIITAEPYLNEEGQLCIKAKVYSFVEADYYYELINLETFDLSPNYPDLYEVPEEITEDEAIQIAKDFWNFTEGDVDEDTGFLLTVQCQGTQYYDGAKCYSMVLRWLVDNSHWSTIDYLYVDAVTGECYRNPLFSAS